VFETIFARLIPLFQGLIHCVLSDDATANNATENGSVKRRSPKAKSAKKTE
jgi:hypothetical protein